MTATLAPSYHLATSMPLVPKGLELSEDLASEGYESEEYDEMGELSDSPSSRTSLSRPTTPPDSTVHASTRLQSATHSTPSEHFTLAVKAERILGLTPGTLAHAKACLENARDEVRRLSAERSSPTMDYTTYPSSFSDGEKEKTDEGLRSRFDRAKKVMSVALPSHTRMPSVVVGTGGKDEEARREKRRRAVDGVIYWQKMVEKLEKEQAAAKQSTRRR